jgi:YgiT-type zinc finger domain-containing protein
MERDKVVGMDVVAEHLGKLEEWGQGHPEATLAEMEALVEERVDVLRAQLLQAAVDWASAREADDTGEGLPCPECGHALESRGQKDRKVTVRGGGTVRLRRRYRRCPACGAGLFPPGPAAGAERE